MSRLLSHFITTSCAFALLSASCNKADDESPPSGDGDGDVGDGDAPGDGDGDVGDGDGDGDAGDGDTGDGDGGVGDGDGDGDGDLGGATGDGDAVTGGTGGVGETPPEARVVIAADLTEPTGIDVEGEYVYWADRVDGHVARCPLNGCGQDEPEIIVSGLEAPNGIDVVGTRLFIGDKLADGTSELLTCELDDCELGTTLLGTVAATTHPFIDVTENNGTLYYGAWPHSGSCDAEGCTASGTTPFFGAPVVSVETDDEYLYSARHGWGEISRCTLPDCEDLTVLVEVTAPLGLAVSGGVLYFGCQPEVYIPGLGGAANVPGIYSCEAEGCDFDDATLLEEGEVSPYALAVAGDYLYFTNVSHGTVVRLTR